MTIDLTFPGPFEHEENKSVSGNELTALLPLSPSREEVIEWHIIPPSPGEVIEPQILFGKFIISVPWVPLQQN